MKKMSWVVGMALFAMLSGCASTSCCAPTEVTYVEKPVSECTRAVRQVEQVSPCSRCSDFPVMARAATPCMN